MDKIRSGRPEAVWPQLPDVRDESIFHAGHVRLIPRQFRSQHAVLLQRPKGYRDDKDRPQEQPVPYHEPSRRVVPAMKMMKVAYIGWRT